MFQIIGPFSSPGPATMSHSIWWVTQDIFAAYINIYLYLQTSKTCLDWEKAFLRKYHNRIEFSVTITWVYYWLLLVNL